MRETELKHHLASVNRRINAACSRCGRRPEDIRLVWVTKTRPVSDIMAALGSGAVCLGENRVQEVLDKFPLDTSLPHELHFIGHLQSNKARKIIPFCRVIQSVDSLPLLERIERVCGELNIRRDVFLQVNTSGEQQKSGFLPEDFLRRLEGLPILTRVRLCGLMTIGPNTEDEVSIRAAFRELAGLMKEIRKKYTSEEGPLSHLKYLSMGMSDDFEVAIEEGSHYIRIGTDLFGPRTR